MCGDSTSFDSILGMCQHQHRRIVLGTLAEEQRSLTLRDLAKTVVKSKHQTPLTEASEQVLTETHRSLHHVHLPKLASEDLIKYNQERQLVEPTEQFDQVQAIISTVLRADPALEAPIEL